MLWVLLSTLNRATGLKPITKGPQGPFVVYKYHIMFKTVEHSVKLQRMAICNTCDLFSKKYETCKSCGCYMPAKTTFAQSECPNGLWQTAEPGQSLINKIEELILESWNK